MSRERTKAATPHRLEKMRGDGQAPRSPELGSSIGLMVACIILQNTAGEAMRRLEGLLTGSLTSLTSVGRADHMNLLWAQGVLGNAGAVWLQSIASLLIVLPALGIGVGFAQGGIISFKTLIHFDKLNPFTGFKRLFSMQSLVSPGRSLAKVSLVGLLTWRGLQDTASRLPQIDGSTDPRAMAVFLGQAMLDVGLAAAEVLMVLAVVDYAYQRWEFAKNARMSLQDVKQEHKQQDGDPMVKAQIRTKQRKMSQARRQMSDVPNATVVVTNRPILRSHSSTTAACRRPKSWPRAPT